MYNFNFDMAKQDLAQSSTWEWLKVHCLVS